MRPNDNIRAINRDRYDYYRDKGYNQKETAQTIGISEKTAGKYERERRALIQEKYRRLEVNKKRLETRASDPDISINDLLKLTDRIEKIDAQLLILQPPSEQATTISRGGGYLCFKKLNFIPIYLKINKIKVKI